ncbi:MAG: CvpA family protein [Desulfobacterales bacterium]|nr:CvpA family protein [Desulfobacterales bacterium]
MNPFDMIIVATLGFCLVRGFFRGLVKELVSIVGVFAGFYVAYTYYMMLVENLPSWISKLSHANLSYLYIFSFFVLFCGVLILVNIVGLVLKFILKNAFIGSVDHIFGLGFGLVKGLLIISVVLINLTAFLPKDAFIVRDSKLAPFVTLISENLAKVISTDMKKNFMDKIEDFKKEWEIRK